MTSRLCFAVDAEASAGALSAVSYVPSATGAMVPACALPAMCAEKFERTADFFGVSPRHQPTTRDT